MDAIREGDNDEIALVNLYLSGQRSNNLSTIFLMNALTESRNLYSCLLGCLQLFERCLGSEPNIYRTDGQEIFLHGQIQPQKL